MTIDLRQGIKKKERKNLCPLVTFLISQYFVQVPYNQRIVLQNVPLFESRVEIQTGSKHTSTDWLWLILA